MYYMEKKALESMPWVGSSSSVYGDNWAPKEALLVFSSDAHTEEVMMKTTLSSSRIHEYPYPNTSAFVVLE